MLLGPCLQLHLLGHIIVSSDVVVILIVVARKSLGSPRRRSHRFVVLTLNDVAVSRQGCSVKCLYFVRRIGSAVVRCLHPKLKAPEAQIHVGGTFIPIVLIVLLHELRAGIDRQPYTADSVRLVRLHLHAAKRSSDLHILIAVPLVRINPAAAHHNHTKDHSHRNNVSHLYFLRSIFTLKRYATSYSVVPHVTQRPDRTILPHEFRYQYPHHIALIKLIHTLAAGLYLLASRTAGDPGVLAWRSTSRFANRLPQPGPISRTSSTSASAKSPSSATFPPMSSASGRASFPSSSRTKEEPASASIAAETSRRRFT